MNGCNIADCGLQDAGNDGGKMARIKKTEGGAKTEGAETSAALPGHGEIVSDLVDQAVGELNRLYRAKGLETALAVGQYVLATFFNGDTANFRSGGNGHISFRELGKREDLQVSWQFIWNSVAVVAQFRQLPANVAEALPLSHHKLLLPVKDAEQKVLLASAAMNEGLSKEALQERVKGARTSAAGESKAGRPVLPAFVKVFTVVKKAVDLAGTENVTEASFVHYPKEKARALLAEIDANIAVLAAMATSVRAHVGP